MNFDNLDIGHLKLFSAMMAHRSVLRVSRVCNLPQPTVSRKLASLREYFQDPLFVRTKSGMEPTPGAQALAEPIEAILRIHRSYLLHADDFDPARTTRTFNIAASDLEHQAFIPGLYSWATNIAPHIQFNPTLVGEGALDVRLETGEVDVAIGGFIDVNAGVRGKLLNEDHYVCAMRRGNPLLDSPLSADVFRDARHVVVHMQHAGHAHQLVEQLLHELCPPENILTVSESFFVAALMVQSSDRILILPSSVAKRLCQKLALETTTSPFELPPIQYKQYWHERFDRDPANQWLRLGIETVEKSVRDSDLLCISGARN